MDSRFTEPYKSVSQSGYGNKNTLRLDRCLRDRMRGESRAVNRAITHRLPFEQYDHGMALMRDGLCGKVGFDME